MLGNRNLLLGITRRSLGKTLESGQKRPTLPKETCPFCPERRQGHAHCCSMGCQQNTIVCNAGVQWFTSRCNCCATPPRCPTASSVGPHRTFARNAHAGTLKAALRAYVTKREFRRAKRHWLLSRKHCVGHFHLPPVNKSSSNIPAQARCSG